MGYYRAGFDVTGVDINPQPNYPFEFYQADAIEFVLEHGHKYAAIAASPPCQRYSMAQRIQKNEHADYVEVVRDILIELGKPYVIENVVGAPLNNPILLCGASFDGLRTYRHRLFETSFDAVAPPHEQHLYPTTKMGRAPVEGEYMSIVGNFSGAEEGRKAMGIPWMTRNELREAIPPAYTEYIGTQLMAHLTQTGTV